MEPTSQEGPTCSDSLVEAALKVLRQPDPWKKAEYTYTIVKLWRERKISRVCPDDCTHLTIPERPARSDDKVRLVPPSLMPRLGKGGSLASRQALLHSLVHIENWAVDLSWDIIARFGVEPSYQLPEAFFDDFVTVAEDECRHFSALAQRLEEVGSHYGALPAHDGLWESAGRTSYSLPARLAVEHCVHEARGLDVLPTTIHRFRSNGDEPSAALLENVIYPEEITHCGAGVRWLRYLHGLAVAAVAGQQQQRQAPLPVEAPPSAQSPRCSTSCAPQPTAADGDGDGGDDDGGTKASSSSTHCDCDATASRSAAAASAAAAVARLDLGNGCSSGCSTGCSSSTQQPQLQPACSAAGPSLPPGGSTQAAAAASNGGAEMEAITKPTMCTSLNSAMGPAISNSAASDTAPLALAEWMVEAARFPSVEAWFHHLIRCNFNGLLKPPFNDGARAKAGFGPEWYLPLAVEAAPAPQ